MSEIYGVRLDHAGGHWNEVKSGRRFALNPDNGTLEIFDDGGRVVAMVAQGKWDAVWLITEPPQVVPEEDSGDAAALWEEHG